MKPVYAVICGETFIHAKETLADAQLVADRLQSGRVAEQYGKGHVVEYRPHVRHPTSELPEKHRTVIAYIIGFPRLVAHSGHGWFYAVLGGDIDQKNIDHWYELPE